MLDNGLHSSRIDDNTSEHQNIGVVDTTPEGEPIYGMKNGVDDELSTLKQEGAAFIDTKIGEQALAKKSC